MRFAFVLPRREKRPRYFVFNNQKEWKESGGTAALVLHGCIEELEEVEEERSFSEVPCRRERA